MKITDELVEKLYLEYNQQYFDNILPINIHVCVSNKLDVMGKFVSLSDTYNFDDEGDLGIILNSSYNYTDEALKLTLLHEMVHEYLLFTNKGEYEKDDPHGEMFVSKCNEISTKHNITQFHRSNIIDNIPLLNNRNFHVITITTDDNKLLIGRLKNKTWVKYFKEYFNSPHSENQNLVEAKFYIGKSHALKQFNTNNDITLSVDEIDKDRFNNELLPWLKEI